MWDMHVLYAAVVLTGDYCWEWSSDGSHPGQWWSQPPDRRPSAYCRCCQKHPHSHALLWHVQLFGAICIQGGIIYIAFFCFIKQTVLMKLRKIPKSRVNCWCVFLLFYRDKLQPLLGVGDVVTAACKYFKGFVVYDLKSVEVCHSKIRCPGRDCIIWLSCLYTVVVVSLFCPDVAYEGIESLYAYVFIFVMCWVTLICCVLCQVFWVCTYAVQYRVF